MLTLRGNIAQEASVHTGAAGQYKHHDHEFAEHDIVATTPFEHGRGTVHTSPVEGYFSIFKPGMSGVYQRSAKKHLHRQTAESEFRCCNRTANDADDAETAKRRNT